MAQKTKPPKPAPKRKPPMKLKGLPPAEQIAVLEAEVKRVRQREEARLIRAARKAGYFTRRVKTADIARIFDPILETHEKTSQLKQLEMKMATTKRKATQEERRLDARRKILLGSFLIAQFEHKPDLKADLQPELEKFLDQHRDANVAASNKALLADYLG